MFDSVLGERSYFQLAVGVPFAVGDPFSYTASEISEIASGRTGIKDVLVLSNKPHIRTLRYMCSSVLHDENVVNV